MCVFSKEIQTAGQIRMEFGIEVVLEGRKILGGVLTQYPPHPPPGRGAKRVSWVHLEPQRCILAQTL